jgi:hypothetical protein
MSRCDLLQSNNVSVCPFEVIELESRFGIRDELQHLRGIGWGLCVRQVRGVQGWGAEHPECENERADDERHTGSNGESTALRTCGE